MAVETLHFSDPKLLTQLYVNDMRNLEEAEQRLDVDLVTREDWLKIEGDETAIAKTKALFELLEAARDQGIRVHASDFHFTLRAVAEGKEEELREIYANPLIIKLKRRSIVPKTLNQKRYLECIGRSAVTFGIGPAGTGKTYLAMAMALKELLEGSIERVILARPAVEAGEALGFLPGELQEKILPYLTPLYDAMNEMVGKEEALQLVERGTVEIAPLAYMRGRTLANSFIVLDEAQNTTHEQMMMFLTRLGDGSRMVITGDITQVDLPKARQSGLKEAARILRDIDGLQLFHFDDTDVVRHPLVQKIINAYARHASEGRSSREDRTRSPL
ncbi:MAG: PhoH family protein [Opitutales bacterium]